MLKTPDRSRLCIKTRGHLLEVLYHSIVPSVVLDDTFTEKNDDGNKVPETDSAYIKRAVKALLRVLPSLTISLVQLVSLISDRVFKGRAAQFATQLARNLPSAFETVSIKRNVETDEETGEEGGQYCSPQIPPSRDELEIPSVYELCSAGVRFVPTEGDLSTVRFEPSTATLYLPRLRLDSSTEVVLRNLVAFEASAAPGDLVLSRYTDFMNGIIDTEKDVRLLRRRGIQLVISTGWVRTPFISVVSFRLSRTDSCFAHAAPATVQLICTVRLPQLCPTLLLPQRCQNVPLSGTACCKKVLSGISVTAQPSHGRGDGPLNPETSVPYS